ncbi:MAG: hypothetical protein AAB588_02705 [Patescibacteria group bacterium]
MGEKERNQPRDAREKDPAKIREALKKATDTLYNYFESNGMSFRDDTFSYRYGAPGWGDNHTIFVSNWGGKGELRVQLQTNPDIQEFTFSIRRIAYNSPVTVRNIQMGEVAQSRVSAEVSRELGAVIDELQKDASLDHLRDIFLDTKVREGETYWENSSSLRAFNEQAADYSGNSAVQPVKRLDYKETARDYESRLPDHFVMACDFHPKVKPGEPEKSERVMIAIDINKAKQEIVVSVIASPGTEEEVLKESADIPGLAKKLMKSAEKELQELGASMQNFLLDAAAEQASATVYKGMSRDETVLDLVGEVSDSFENSGVDLGRQFTTIIGEEVEKSLEVAVTKRLEEVKAANRLEIVRFNMGSRTVKARLMDPKTSKPAEIDLGEVSTQNLMRGVYKIAADYFEDANEAEWKLIKGKKDEKQRTALALKGIK